jgi:predicted nuclease of predicted toxin-antitoxin system
VKFLLDHDVPDDVRRVLRQAGHEVDIVSERLERTASDHAVFDEAQKISAVLVTCNRDDFIDLARGRSHCGLIILIRRRTRIAECGKLLRLLDTAGETGIHENINFA